MRHFHRGAGEGGFTLLELLMTISIMAIITPAITFLFVKMTQGMAADEMRNAMASMNDRSLLRIHERVLSNKHMCQNDTSGQTYLAMVKAGMSAATNTQYPILAGSLLPLAQVNGVGGPGSFSPTVATAANFGNSLLFGSYDSPQTVGKSNFIAPITIIAPYTTGPAATAGPGGTPLNATIVVDLYRFNYYYLTPGQIPHGQPATFYKVIEWQSVQYADYYEINAISDGGLRTEVVNDLVNLPTYVTGPPYNLSANNGLSPVVWAWDPTQSTPTANTFYNLTAGGGINLSLTASIQEGIVTKVTRISSGIMSSGFNYGIMPNSSLYNAPIQVPLFAAASGQFPSGFETGISGSSDGMEVLTREALVAKGASPIPIVYQTTMIHNARDVW